LVLLLAPALVHPGAVLCARRDWRADLITPFVLPAVAVTACVALVLAWRHRRLAAAMMVLAVMQAVPLFRYYGSNPVPPVPASRERLRVLLLNLLVDNERYEEVARLIEREQPDVVGLVEVTPEWLLGLERTSVRSRYPYRIELPLGTRGLALWLRPRPESRPVVESLTVGGSPLVRVPIRFSDRLVSIWLVHPPNPLSEASRANPDLAALGAAIGRHGGTLLVIGDLNRTDGSPHFDDFVRATGLRDSRLGFGPQPSWPSGMPIMIAIDHAFLSSGLAVVDRRLGPHVGSDHLPVILEVAPAAASGAPTNSATQASQASP
jgi:endonuclease/exonuclease/phosphatase (EEP) superfamily protein YafD